jgi:hypothetical protein
MKTFLFSLGISQCGRWLSFLLLEFLRSDWLVLSPRISPKQRGKWCAIRRDVDPSRLDVTWSNRKIPDTGVQIQWRFVTSAATLKFRSDGGGELRNRSNRPVLRTDATQALAASLRDRPAESCGHARAPDPTRGRAQVRLFRNPVSGRKAVTVRLLGRHCRPAAQDRSGRWSGSRARRQNLRPRRTADAGLSSTDCR